MALGPRSRQKPRPTASVFVYLSPSGHVFNIAWQAMIKTYNIYIYPMFYFFNVLHNHICAIYHSPLRETELYLMLNKKKTKCSFTLINYISMHNIIKYQQIYSNLISIP